jgi:hypothetical protein
LKYILEILKNLIYNLRCESHLNWKFWITISIFLKFLIVCLLFSLLGLSFGTPYIYSGDGPFYYNLAGNIAHHQTYSLYKDIEGKFMPYTGRMPLYEFIMAFFMWIDFPKELVFKCIIIIQLLFSSVSTYLIALISFKLFKNRLSFVLSFFTYGINTYMTIYDLSILTESLYISFTIIAINLILSENVNYKRILFSGLFFCFSIFLRQYGILILLFTFLYILITKLRLGFKTIIRSFILLALPLTISLFVWSLRNYCLKKKFIPLVDDLHAGYSYSDGYRSLMNLNQSLGFDLVYWNYKAEICYFIQDQKSVVQKNVIYTDVSKFPCYIRKDSLLIESLEHLRHVFKNHPIMINPNDTSLLLRKYDQKVKETCDSINLAFKKNHMFDYFINAPIRLIKNSVIHSASYNLTANSFSNLKPFHKIIKLFYESLFWIIFSSSILFALIYYNKSPELYYLLICALTVLTFSPLVLRRIEYRYFVFFYPIGTILFTGIMNKLIQFLLKEKSFNNGKKSS